MARPSLLQRLKDKFRHAQQEADEHRAAAAELQARQAAGEGPRMRTALDADEVPAVDISKRLLESQQPPTKGKPRDRKGAHAKRPKANSQAALQSMGSGGGVFGPAPAQADARVQAQQEPASFLTGAPSLAPTPAPAAAPRQRRTFSLATPSPLGEAALSDTTDAGTGLTGAPSYSVHADDDLGDNGRGYTRPSSREALHSLFAGAYVGRSASSLSDDRSRLFSNGQGAYLSGSSAVMPPAAPAPPPPPTVRREFSLSTPPPFGTPPADPPAGYEPQQHPWAGTSLTGAAGLLSFASDPQAQDGQAQGWGFSLEGAPSLAPRTD